MTEEELHVLYNHIKTLPDDCIHPFYMGRLLFAAKKQFATLPRVTEIVHTNGPHVTFVIVGDLHGQLQDLLYIIEKHGLPGPGRCMYLFNGDFVDRGAYSAEVITLLLAFKLVYPDSVHLNRGNHEDTLINQRYGFCDEVIDKFGSLHMFTEFQELWNLLPIASTVDGLALVVHGGLFRLEGVTLKHLRAIPRGPCNLQPRNFQETIMVDLLWSDPCEEPGHHAGQRGGNTIRFGADVTHRFLAQNKLKMLIRSHEVPTSNKGFDVTHNNRLVTVFSASNYCGHRGNSGAVMVFQRDLKYTFHEHWAPALESFRVPRLPSQKKINLDNQSEEVKQDILRQVKKLVVENKTDLQWFWNREDTAGTGTVPLATWRHGMNVVLNVALPWEKYEDSLIKKCTDANDEVCYGKFLQQFQVRVKPEFSKWKAHVVQKVHDALVLADLNLADMVGVFDQDNDGFVDVHELSRVFRRLEIDVTKDQIEELLADIVVCGQVNVIALIESLQIKRYADLHPDIQKVIDHIGDLLMRNEASETVRLFDHIDENQDGRLQHHEFINVVGRLLDEEQARGKPNCPIVSEEMLLKVTKAIDANDSGTIDFMEFVDVFHRQRSSMDRLLEQICRVFYKYQDSLFRAFQFMDVNGDGVLTPEEFADGLMTFNALVSEPLSASTMDAVVKYIDRNSDGCISYQEFCSAFYFVDTSSDVTEPMRQRHKERFSKPVGELPKSVVERRASKGSSHEFPEQFKALTSQPSAQQ
eukprot:GGOE01001550.1.p1 GENE.GGOE01001550.1~~GGOE01001550.1.p1  ORF type:complete len:870 (+),score=263.78 GGOE01001550.1:356-2611(+)